MAGDWIKVEKATARKPEVLRIADVLGVHPDHAFGLCIRFWFWCDDQLDSCHARSVTFVTLVHVVGHAGFASALVDVGWLRVRDGSLEVPNFDRHLSESAKKRSLSVSRQQKRRSKAVTQTSRAERYKIVTREREEIEKSIKHSHSHAGTEIPKETHLANPKFSAVWERWGRHLLEQGKPLTVTAQESQLYKLADFAVDEATEIVEFSLLKGAKNLILNGDHKGKPPPRSRSSGKAVASAQSHEDFMREALGGQ